MRALTLRTSTSAAALAARSALATLVLLAGCGRAQVADLGLSSSASVDGASAGLDGSATLDGDVSLDGSVGDPDGGVVPPDADVPPACTSAPDCYLANGRPPPCPNEVASWTCQSGQCVAACGPVSCTSDCDCDLRSACLGGTCGIANRLNLCCTTPFCPAGQACELPGGGMDVCPAAPDGGLRDGGLRDGGTRDGGLRDGGTRDGGSIDAGPPAPGAVGSACTAQTTCSGNNGFCLDPSNGFPDGYCSAPCGQGVGRCPSGAACRQLGGGGMSASLCLDVCSTNGDCRAGYACVRLAPTQDRVCMPAPAGSTNPMGAAVGGACSGESDCGIGLQCLADQNFPDGYCSKLFCDPQNNPCPANATCTPTPAGVPLCLESCVPGSTTCRPGYQCLGVGGQGVCVVQN